MENKEFSVAIMYAVTPCHAGSGSALGVVDLPIQREKHTNWPMIQSSGVKGAFRANFDKYKSNIKDENKTNKEIFNQLAQSIFGTDDFAEYDAKGKKVKSIGDVGGFAGSSSFSDAKILAFPMRSNVSPFVWITCPSVLKRLSRDLFFAGKIDNEITVPNVEEDNAIIIKGLKEDTILLEDYEVKAKNSEVKGFEKYLKKAERLLLVSDEVFNYGVSNCTQIMAQIKIDSSTGTTQDGSLRYQEELPSDTIMYTVIHWGDSKNSLEENLKADTIRKFITKDVISDFIQIAGDETCGRGIFQLNWGEEE